MSLRIAPRPSYPTVTSNTTTSTTSTTTGGAKPSILPRGAPSAPGVPDTLRSDSVGSGTTPALSSNHPLEARLAHWTETQDALKLESLRRTFGMAEPVRRGMELRIVREGSFWTPAAVQGAGAVPSVHEDILTGRDAEISWEDVYTGAADGAGGGVGGGLLDGVHDEMERKVGMGSW